MGLKLVVLVGSVRSERQGIKAAHYVERSLRAGDMRSPLWILVRG
jgi:NAD(P)H-dependent FMN reductase